MGALGEEDRELAPRSGEVTGGLAAFFAQPLEDEPPFTLAEFYAQPAEDDPAAQPEWTEKLLDALGQLYGGTVVGLVVVAGVGHPPRIVELGR